MQRSAAVAMAVLLAAGCSSGVKDGSEASSSGVAAPVHISDGASAQQQAMQGGTAQAPHKRAVYYDFDSSAIHDADMPVVKKNAEFLLKHPHAEVTVEGNCDERGSPEYNLALGERRALAAKSLLTHLGVADSQIKVISYGKERPEAKCHDESCWQKNRRSDLVYGGPG